MNVVYMEVMEFACMVSHYILSEVCAYMTVVIKTVVEINKVVPIAQ